MGNQIALLLTLEESEIDALEKLSKEELQVIQEQAARSVRKELSKLGLIEETKHVVLEESIPFSLGPIGLEDE